MINRNFKSNNHTYLSIQQASQEDCSPGERTAARAHKDLTLDTNTVAKPQGPSSAGPLGRPDRALGSRRLPRAHSGTSNPPVPLQREPGNSAGTPFSKGHNVPCDALTSRARVQFPAPTQLGGRAPGSPWRPPWLKRPDLDPQSSCNKTMFY